MFLLTDSFLLVVLILLCTNKTYLIFVNFGTPLHYISVQKYAKKCIFLRQNSQNEPKGAKTGQSFAISMIESTLTWKKYRTAGCGGCDEYHKLCLKTLKAMQLTQFVSYLGKQTRALETRGTSCLFSSFLFEWTLVQLMHTQRFSSYLRNYFTDQWVIPWGRLNSHRNMWYQGTTRATANNLLRQSKKCVFRY